MTNKKKKKLEVVKNEEPQEESLKDLTPRNFWNSCPRQLEYLPEEPCPKGMAKKNASGRVIEEAECPWSVDSEEYNFCFWKYVHENSSSDGLMKPMLQNEIAEMYGCSSTKIHFILKEAMEKLRKSPHSEALKEFLEEEPDTSDPGILPADIPTDTEDSGE